MELVDPATLVFVDESGTHLAMTPRYGRAPRGERVVGSVPRNHGPNTTLFAALSLDGIQAAMTLEGAADRAAFNVFVAHILAPTLTPGQLVIWGDSGKLIGHLADHGCLACLEQPPHASR